MRTLAATFLLCSLAACSGDDDDSHVTPPPPPGTGGTMTATLSTGAFSSSTAAGVYSSANGGLIVINAATLAVPAYSIAMSFSGINQTGTYALTRTAPLRTISIGRSDGLTWGTSVTGGSGSVTFTKLTSTRAEGTFTFTAPPASGNSAALTATNGQFALNLIAQ